MNENFDYGLDLTQNSKVGWAFSLSRSASCVNATETCKKLCYGNGIRYQSKGQKSKRFRNFTTCEFLLAAGGSDLLAQNLLLLIDQARPVDWLTSQITGSPTKIPYTLRIHDVGDFYSVEYVNAWALAVKQRPQCKFWFYTRSFIDPEIVASLVELASIENCRGFLSIDSDNFEQGLATFAKYPGVFKLALLQEREDKLPPELITELTSIVKHGQMINFPYHRAGRHVPALQLDPLINCPQVTTKALPLQVDRSLPKPCQSCALCLPK